MNRALCVLLLLVSIQLTTLASEEEFVPWQSVSIKSPEIPVVGIVTIEASTQGGRYQKLIIGAFGRTYSLAAAELKRIEGFPLSGLTLTHEAGYAALGGHTLNLRFNRTSYDDARKPAQETVIISVPKDAATIISEAKRK